jgi:hypothetical protein
MYMLPVERILKESDYIFADGILRGKPFRPCQQGAAV